MISARSVSFQNGKQLVLAGAIQLLAERRGQHDRGAAADSPMPAGWIASSMLRRGRGDQEAPSRRQCSISASTGSRFAARHAGRIPNTSPLAIATPTADANAHGGAREIERGKRERQRPVPRRDPEANDRASDRHAASVRNSAMICRLRAPTALSRPISAVRSSPRRASRSYQHARDDQADRGDRGKPGRDHPEDRVERQHERVLRDDRDVLGARVPRFISAMMSAFAAFTIRLVASTSIRNTAEVLKICCAFATGGSPSRRP